MKNIIKSIKLYFLKKEIGFILYKNDIKVCCICYAYKPYFCDRYKLKVNKESSCNHFVPNNKINRKFETAKNMINNIFNDFSGNIFKSMWYI